MKWKGRRQSTNVEDRRGRRVAGAPSGGLPIGGKGGISLVGLLVIIGLSLAFGIDPMTLLEGSGGQTSGSASGPGEPQAPLTAAEREAGDFASTVLADTEDTWHTIFRQEGASYIEPKLVLFTGQVRSACGSQSSAVGPFYCPGDQKVYVDLSFFDELASRFGAPGDFAQAYVIAHEVGHHVQNLIGISDKVHGLRQRASQVEGNALSVRMELQADCFAGVWGHYAGTARQLLESGDIEEGLRAASVIGDDHLQEEARGYSRPETFTHGTSAQRVRWFKTGLESGDWKACDTFSAQTL